MKKFDQVFSGEYANRKAIGNNFVLLFMYRFSYPFAVALIKLRLSPNQITWLSIAFAILAFVALVREDGWTMFFGLLGSVGVAGFFATEPLPGSPGNFRRKIFRFDHMSDLFKICLMFLGAGLRYDNSLVWAVSSSVLFLFMYFMVLHHDIGNARRRAEENKPPPKPHEDMSMKRSEPPIVPEARIRDRYRIVSWAVKFNFLYSTFQLLLSSYRRLRTSKIYLGLRAALTTINGHTLLLFFLVPLGPGYAVWSFIYFGLLALAGIRRNILGLLAIPKP